MLKSFKEINFSINDFNSLVGSKYDNVKGFQKMNDESAEIVADNLNLFSFKVTQADVNVPDTITKEMILKAIQDFNENNIPHTFKESRDYDVIIDGNRYPPKAIIGLASRYTEKKRVLLPSEFSAGHDKKCFKILLNLGYMIAPKTQLESLDSILKEEEVRRKKSRILSTQDLISKLLNKETQRKKRKAKKKESQVTTYERDQDVVEYAHRRSNGICDLCNVKAPFTNKDGKPFLEVHHIKQLSKGGDDWIDNVVALCPNCHRKMHIINDKKDTETLKIKALKVL